MSVIIDVDQDVRLEKILNPEEPRVRLEEVLQAYEEKELSPRTKIWCDGKKACALGALFWDPETDPARLRDIENVLSVPDTILQRANARFGIEYVRGFYIGFDSGPSYAEEIYPYAEVQSERWKQGYQDGQAAVTAVLGE